MQKYFHVSIDTMGDAAALRPSPPLNNMGYLWQNTHVFLLERKYILLKYGANNLQLVRKLYQKSGHLDAKS